MQNAMYELGWRFAEALYRDLLEGKLETKTENHENQTVCDSIDFRDGARLPALAMAAGGAEVRANQD